MFFASVKTELYNWQDDSGKDLFDVAVEAAKKQGQSVAKQWKHCVHVVTIRAYGMGISNMNMPHQDSWDCDPPTAGGPK
ncbi:MAG: hypothetical protein ACLP9L_05430 [Thermoguttaceae bacterium]